MLTIGSNQFHDDQLSTREGVTKIRDAILSTDWPILTKQEQLSQLQEGYHRYISFQLLIYCKAYPHIHFDKRIKPYDLHKQCSRIFNFLFKGKGSIYANDAELVHILENQPTITNYESELDPVFYDKYFEVDGDIVKAKENTKFPTPEAITQYETKLAISIFGWLLSDLAFARNMLEELAA